MIDPGLKDGEKLSKASENLEYCKDSREALIREINNVNKQLKGNLICRREYDDFFSQKFNGKNRLEWLDFCNRYIESKGGLNEKKSEIKELSNNIRFCKKTKKTITQEIKELNENYENKVISREEYYAFLDEGINGKTRLEWMDFCSRYIESKGEAVNSYKKEAREQVYYNIKPIVTKSLLPVLGVLLAILLVYTLFLPSAPTGFAAITAEFNYTDAINLTVKDNYEYLWPAGDIGRLKSLSLDGSIVTNSLSKAQTISKDGYAKVYLEYDNESYLIFDSNRLSEAGIGKVTALAVSNETGNDNLNPPTEQSDDKSITIDIEGDTAKDTESILEFNISSIFSWDVDYSKLCTKWQVNEISLCYGSIDCCAFIDLESSGNWNDSFYLSYGRYEAGLRNNIKAQLVYANYSLDIENLYSDIVYSDVKELTAEFYEPALSFTDVCIDTCLLPGFNLTQYRLVFVVENATLTIHDIRYSTEKEINISKNAPALVKEIENITIYKDEFLKINLSDYFYDEDGDKLTYTAHEADNISAIMMYNIVLLLPEYNFTGKRYMYFTAYDGYYNISSDVFSVEVIEKPLSPSEVNVSEQLVKPRIRINEPVKWVKKVNASGDVINLSVDISSDALNVTVRDVKENRTINEDSVKVNDEGIIKNATAYRAEKRIEQIEKVENRLESKKLEVIREDPTAKVEIGSINKELLKLDNERNKLTGYAVATKDKGLLTRLFEWLLKTEITGYAVADKEDKGKHLGHNKTKENKVIIEDIVEYVEIEYWTEAPVSEEMYINSYTKQVIISSGVHYENISAYTNITPEASSSAISLYRIVNGSRELVGNVSYYDKNSNGLSDVIEWTVPSLSNETYEVSIEIINVHSYPSLYGNWTVMFETNGMDNLTITAARESNYSDDSTRWHNESENSGLYDLKFLEVRCGNKSLEYEWIGENCYEDECSVFIEDYSCNETGYEVSKVVTPKRHVLLFNFGGQEAYAYNSVSGINITFVYPTLTNDTVTTNTSVEINISITNASNLAEFKFNWNGTNTTIAEVNSTSLNITFNLPSLDRFNWKINGSSYDFYNDSLVLMMNFDNVSALGEQTSGVNNKTVDASKYGNNGTLNGGAGPTWNATGKYWGAFKFDGVNDYIQINSAAALHNGKYTISAWAYPVSEIPTGEEELTIAMDVNSATFYLMLSGRDLFGQGTGWGIGWFGGAGWKGTSTGDSVASQLNKWTYVVGVYNGSQFSIYIDGILKNNSTYSYTGSSSTLTRIGYYSPAYPEPFNGTIDEVRIWNRSLSAEEIQQHYYSNLRKYDTDKWMFYTNQSGIVNYTVSFNGQGRRTFEKYNSTDWYSYTNQSDLTEGIYTYQGFVKDGAGNEDSTDLRYVTIDTPPTVHLVSPINSTGTQNSEQNFSCNITDNGAIANLTLYIWNSSGSLNYTNATVLTGTKNETNWTYTFPYEDSFLWNCYGCDTTSNCVWSQEGNYTFIYDTSVPTILLVSPTPTNGSILLSSQGWAYVNASISETATTCYLEWGGINYSMTISGTICYLNKSQNEGGEFSYRVWAGDGLNWGVSEQREVTVNRPYLLWSRNLTGGVEHSIIFNDLIYTPTFGISGAPVYVHNATNGDYIRNFSCGGTYCSPTAPVIDAYNNFIYVYEHSGILSKYNLTNPSDIKWSVDLATGADEETEGLVLNMNGSLLYISVNNGNKNQLKLVNTTDGNVLYTTANNKSAGWETPLLDESNNWVWTIGSENVPRAYKWYANNLTPICNVSLNGTGNKGNYPSPILVNDSYTGKYAVIFTVREGSYVSRINATCGKEWETNLSGTVTGGMSAYHNGKVVVSSNDNRTYALNISDGSQIWNYTLASPPGNTFDHFWHGPVIGGGMVFTATHWDSGQNYFLILNETDGALLWNITVGDESNNQTLSCFHPVISEGVVFNGLYSPPYTLYAWKVGPGNKVNWSFDANSNHTKYLEGAITAFGPYIDVTAPTVTIIYPTNGSNISSNSISLNASAADNLASSLTYYWVINGTINTTTINTNTTFNASDGYYNLTLFVSDGTNNGSSTISFTLDTTAPTINAAAVSPTIGTAGTIFNITANVSDNLMIKTVTAYIQKQDENNTATITLSLNNGLYNGTWNSSGKADGTYVIDIIANDTLGNEKEKENGAVIALSPSANNTFINSSVNLTTNTYVIINATNTTDTWLNITPQANITASVAIAKYSDNIETVEATGISELGKYISIIVDNNTNNNISFAEIRVYYTDAEVTAANLIESTLRLYKFNESSALWDLVSPGGVETTLNYVWGNVSSFSSFGVFGTTVSTTAATTAATTSRAGGICTPKWNCTEWNNCSQEGKQTRTCTRVGTCFMGEKPEEERNCTYNISQVEIGETCSDGIKNQNEEGVDCGGVCKPCKELPAPVEKEFSIIKAFLILWAIVLFVIVLEKISKRK